MGPFGVYMGWGWAGWVLRKDIDSMLSLQFLSISQLNNKHNVCLWCSLLFFPQLFPLDQMVSLFLYFPLSWSLVRHMMSSRLPVTEAHPPLPAYIGGCSVLGVCAAARLAGLIPPETPHLSFSWGRLLLFLPKCKMVIIFLKPSIWEDSTLPYLGASSPPNGFLVENFKARHLLLSALGSYVLSSFSSSGVVVLLFLMLAFEDRKFALIDQLMYFKE